MFQRKYLLVFAVILYSVLIFALIKSRIEKRNSVVCEEKVCISFCCNGGKCSQSSINTFESNFMDRFYFGTQEISVQTNNLGCKLQAIEDIVENMFISSVTIFF